ncbi:MAG TPA: 16S rRNA (cytosine(967)-C(5))-methyltransferase RsmB [Myxococcaceae bacterium]|jgi:16S rRNA (cytosine967-C5)-methyltransferase
MNARAAAIQVLSRVSATDAFLNVVLDTTLSELRPEDARDAGLITELCYGAARREMALDHALAQVSDHKLSTLEDRVLAALRVGAYQVFYTRVPRHAAVAETVEALKSLRLQRAAGFANAVLRKVAAMSELPLPPESEPVKRLAVRESHPEWLVERWTRQFGPARAEQMLVADNVPPPVVVRANRSRNSRDRLLEELRGAGVDASPTSISPAGVVLGSPGPLEDVLGYREGLWQVQDEAAQLVVEYAAIPDGARVLDACAAPGGKACALAERVRVTACDVHKNKLRKIESEAKRLGVEGRLEVKQHDAQKPFSEEYDAVVLDAPCSGLGTLRRHPELRYRRKPEDVGRLAALQVRLLESCQAAVAPGGLLVYAVCSVDPQEGSDQVELFLRSHPDFTAEPPPAMPAGAPLAQGYLRTLPGPEALDGFFAARLRRTY